MFRVLLANPDERFVPGLFVRLSVPAGPAGTVLVVSDSVIGTEQNLKFAYAVSSSNTVEKRFVVPGPLVNGQRVIHSGLQASDRVIVNGTLRVLFPGQPVQPQEQADQQLAQRQEQREKQASERLLKQEQRQEQASARTQRREQSAQAAQAAQAARLERYAQRAAASDEAPP
jgi:hypothetical protein